VLHLRVLGGLSLHTPEGEVHGRAGQRRRLAILAMLRMARSRLVSRDRLITLLWPEANTKDARHLLADSIHVLRTELGEDLILGLGDDLAVNEARLDCDAVEFQRAARAGESLRAVGMYTGPFLDGVFFSGSVELEQWVEGTRAQLASDFHEILERVATESEGRGAFAESAKWWRRCSTDDPFDGRAVLGLMRALAASGDTTGALQIARTHERFVGHELETWPDPKITALAATLRRSAAAREKSDAQIDSTPAAQVLDREVQGTDAPLPPLAHALAPSLPSPARSAGRTRHRVARYALSIGLLTIALLGGRHELHTRAAGERTSDSSRSRTASVAAHDLVLRGRDEALLRSDSGVISAANYYRRAIREDSNYAPAWAGLAYANATAIYGSGFPTAATRAMYAEGLKAAARAVALDDSLVEARLASGLLDLLGCDVRAASRELKRGVELGPNVESTHEAMANLYEWTERPRDALSEARLALLANPLSPTANAELATALFFARRYDDALANLSQLTRLQPPMRRIAARTGANYIMKGMWPAAIDALQEAARRQPHAAALLAYALARGGRREEAERMRAQMIDAWQSGNSYAFNIALMEEGLGNRDQALDWIARSCDDHSLRVDVVGPLFDDLRKDPRFARVRRHLGLEDSPIGMVIG